MQAQVTGKVRGEQQGLSPLHRSSVTPGRRWHLSCRRWHLCHRRAHGPGQRWLQQQGVQLRAAPGLCLPPQPLPTPLPAPQELRGSPRSSLHELQQGTLPALLLLPLHASQAHPSSSVCCTILEPSWDCGLCPPMIQAVPGTRNPAWDLRELLEIPPATGVSCCPWEFH